MSISFNDKSKNYCVNNAADAEFQEDSKVIKEAILEERLEHLRSYYDDEAFGIETEAESSRMLFR